MRSLSDWVIFYTVYPYVAERNALKKRQRADRKMRMKQAREKRTKEYKTRSVHAEPYQDIIYPRHKTFPGYSGHNIILWTLLAPVTLAIPLIYWTVSKKHYWHF